MVSNNVFTGLLQGTVHEITCDMRKRLHLWHQSFRISSPFGSYRLLSFTHFALYVQVIFYYQYLVKEILKQTHSSNFFQKRQPHADLQCSVNPTEPEHSFNHKNRARFSSAQHIKDIRGSSVQKCDELFATCSLPVFILEVMRDRSMRRGGRIGVDVFVVLVFFLSKGLLILERGAKIPEKN